jgi:hypothetical protein
VLAGGIEGGLGLLDFAEMSLLFEPLFEFFHLELYNLNNSSNHLVSRRKAA